jgi:ankyrin repeat protein
MNQNTLLMVACRTSNLGLVELLISRGALVNLQNEDGDTALHIAASSDRSDTIMKCLLVAGANDKSRNNKGLIVYD